MSRNATFFNLEGIVPSNNLNCSIPGRLVSMKLCFAKLLLFLSVISVNSNPVDQISFSPYVNVHTDYNVVDSNINGMNYSLVYNQYYVGVDQNFTPQNYGYGDMIKIVTANSGYNQTYGYTDYAEIYTWDYNLFSIEKTTFGYINGDFVTIYNEQVGSSVLPELTLAFFENDQKTINTTTYTLSKHFEFKMDVNASSASWSSAHDTTVIRGITFDHEHVLQMEFNPIGESDFQLSVYPGWSGTGYQYPVELINYSGTSPTTLDPADTTDCNGKAGFFVEFTTSQSVSSTNFDIELVDQGSLTTDLKKHWAPVMSFDTATHTALSFNIHPPLNGYGGMTNTEYTLSKTDALNSYFHNQYQIISDDSTDGCQPLIANQTWTSTPGDFDHVRWWISSKLEILGSNNTDLALYSHDNQSDGKYVTIDTLAELDAFSNKINSLGSGNFDNYYVIEHLAADDPGFYSNSINGKAYSSSPGEVFIIAGMNISARGIVHEHIHFLGHFDHRSASAPGFQDAITSPMLDSGDEINGYEWLQIDNKKFWR